MDFNDGGDAQNHFVAAVLTDNDINVVRGRLQ